MHVRVACPDVYRPDGAYHSRTKRSGHAVPNVETLNYHLNIQIAAVTDAKTIGKLINQSFPYPDLGKELLKDTQSVLSNVYEVDYGTPHDVIFDIFKTPDKEEACIGKLLSVCNILRLTFHCSAQS